MQMKLIQDKIGSRCMVLSQENELLFFGQVGYCDTVNQIIRVNGEGPGAVPYVKPDDWVKLNLKDGMDSLGFLLVEGVVEQVIHSYFVLRPKLILEKREEREYFRQSVLQKVRIALVNGVPSDHSCMILDLSATGIGIQSNEVYQLGDSLWLSNQRIRPKGATHNLECIVVRQQTLETGPYRYFYGCRFENLSDEARDRLCCDIFALQVAQLHSKRGK